MRKTLEVCVDSVESAMAAERGGATRLELCSNLIVGGTTPGIPLYEAVRKYTNIPINVLLRPRFGDFCYTEYEFDIIEKEVNLYRTAGADGVVVGCLLPDGSLDAERMNRLRKCAGEMNMTLHRAFDVCREPVQVLEQVKQIGIQTILTSGQKNCCYDGRELIRELLKTAGEEIDILIGGGVSAEVMEKLRSQMPANHFHMSGKEVIPSRMTYRKEEVSMGVSGISEYDIWRTSEEKIARAREALFDTRR